MSPRVANAEKRYRISLLLDAYGELLTDKQQDFLRRYYEEDFSFGEIAREYKVSRQAIFDSVKHGEAALENYERVLGLVGDRGASRGNISGIRLSAVARRAEAGSEQLRQWLASVGEQGEGNETAEVLASLADDLESIASDLKRAAGDSVAATGSNGDAMAGSAKAERSRPEEAGSLLVGDGPEVD